MALSFTDSDTEAHSGFCKFCVYGASGIGKTMLAATLPDVAIVSVERGLLSLNQANQIRVFGEAKNVPVLNITDANDLDDALQFFLSSDEAKQFQSVALDSISDIAEVVLSNAKSKTKDPRQAYGVLADHMSQVIRAFRDLDKHVYFSAKQDRVQDANGLLLFGPSMPGKQLSVGLPYFFDEVFAMDVSPRQEDGSTYRFLRTAADAQWQCKDRSGVLLPVEEPNLAKIIAKIQHSAGSTQQ